MNERDESLGPELQALLASARSPVAVAADARARVRGRLGATLALPGAALAKPATLAAPTKALAGAKLLTLGLVIGFGCGVATTWIAHPVPHQQFTSNIVDAPAPPLPAPAPAVAPSVPAEPAPIPIEVAPPAPARPTPRARVTHEAPPTETPIETPIEAPAAVVAEVANPPPDVHSERSLLDRARRALTEGRSSDALDALREHEAEFPEGRLVEEREALAVRVLLASGRRDEARTRATRLLADHPRSIFRQVVSPALE